MPKTKMGKWSLGLIILMPILFVIATSFMSTFYKSVQAGDTVLADVAQRPALALTMLAGVVCGVSAFITGLIAIINFKDRGILVFVSTIIGAAPTLYIIGEVVTAISSI